MTDEIKPLRIAVIGAGEMALVIHGGFEMLDRVLIPQGLRLRLNRG